MPIGPQPPRHKGTIDEPYSPLNLRLVLAGFGLVCSTGLAVLLWHYGKTLAGWCMIVLAVIAAVDLVVIQLRRRARRRADPDRHSLFE